MPSRYRTPILFSTVLRNASITAPVRFPEFRVPPDAVTVARPLPDNTGTIYINRDSSGSKTGAQTVRLRPSDLPLEFAEENMVNLWLSVDTANDGVQILSYRAGLLDSPQENPDHQQGGGGGGGGVGGGGGTTIGQQINMAGSGHACVRKGTEIVELGGVFTAEEIPWDEWIEIRAGDFVLQCTPDHPIYTEEGKKNADDLVAGEYIITRNGLVQVSTATRLFEESVKLKVSVPGSKLFWANGILSHNKS